MPKAQDVCYIAFSVENGEVERVPRLRRRRFCAMTEPIFNGNVYNSHPSTGQQNPNRVEKPLSKSSAKVF